MARQPNIDPATGLDLDDLTNQAVIAQAQAAPLGSPAFAARAAGFDVDPTAADQLGAGAPIQHPTATGTAADMQRVVDEAPPLVQPPPPEAPAGPTVPSPSQAAQAAAAPPSAGPEASTSKREVEQTVLSPESKAAMAQGRALSQRQGVDAATATAAAKVKNASDLALQRDTGRLEAQQADLEAKQAEYAETQHQLAQARHDQVVAKAEQRISDAQKRVDADFETSQKSYWADKSTGFKIIATLLEGASIRDSRILGEDPNNNPVIGTIREAVNADKAKKLAQYQKSKDYLAEVKKGPEQARQALLDARADIDAATARQLQITTKKAEALKTSRKVDPARLQALLDATNADAQAKLDETKQGLVDRELVRVAPTNRKVTTITAPGEKRGTDTLVYGEGGQPVARARTPKEAEAANKATKNFRQLDGLLSALEDSYRKSGKAYLPGTAAYDEQKTLKAQADIAYKNVAELGALSGSDNALIGNAIGGAWTGAQGASKIRAARDAMTRGHAAALDSLGLPGKQLAEKLRTPAGAGVSDSGAPITVARLKQALVNAARAGNSAAVAEIRKQIAAAGVE
jgi:hypothetical protein